MRLAGNDWCALQSPGRPPYLSAVTSNGTALSAGAPKSTRKARVLPEFGQRESLDSERITFTMFNL